MPEHVHLLVSELREGALASAIRSLKQSIGQRSRHKPFWYPRYYDFNVFSAQKESEKLDYMHFNPVKRGLCVTPEEWRWSSAGGSRSARIPTASALPLTMEHPEPPDPEPWGCPIVDAD
jgi:hypothetical protein